MSTRPQPKSGFTLIELLVVVAIISLLAAILYPVFEQARNRANIASCTSNVKQLCLGILQYTQDYDDYMPHYGDPTGAYVTANGQQYLNGTAYSNSERIYGEFGWAGQASIGACQGSNSPTSFDGTCTADDSLWQAPRVVNPYIRDTTVVLCPAWGMNRLNWPWAGGSADYKMAGDVLGNSYAINTRLIFPTGWVDGRNQGTDMGWGYTPSTGQSVQNSAKLGMIQHPESVGLIADAFMAWSVSSGPTASFFHGTSEGTSGFICNASGQCQQQALCVYGFVDGHAKLMNPLGYTRSGYAYYDGGTISWMDDRYSQASWVPGTIPTGRA